MWPCAWNGNVVPLGTDGTDAAPNAEAEIMQPCPPPQLILSAGHGYGAARAEPAASAASAVAASVVGWPSGAEPPAAMAATAAAATSVVGWLPATLGQVLRGDGTIAQELVQLDVAGFSWIA